MVYLVVGLGNPGKHYHNTLHNIGFRVVAELATRLGSRLRMSARCHARLGGGVLGPHTLLLAQPQTYMNASGDAVAAIVRLRHIAPAHILVVLDDADLECGRIRVRPDGSSGGHRGLESVIHALGTSAFPRVRVGIGRDPQRDLVAQVLTPVSPDQEPIVQKAVRTAADAVLCIVERGLAETMNRFNGPIPGLPPPHDG